MVSEIRMGIHNPCTCKWVVWLWTGGYETDWWPYEFDDLETMKTFLRKKKKARDLVTSAYYDLDEFPLPDDTVITVVKTLEEIEKGE